MSRGKYKDIGGFLQQISVSLGFLWADMARLLKLEPFSPEAAKFFTNIIKAQIKERQKTGKKRNDFIQSLLQVSNLSNEYHWHHSTELLNALIRKY